jgi:hypothetical protein
VGLIAVLVLWLAGGQQGGDDWAPVWERLAAARAAPAGSEERAARLEELAEVAAAAEGTPEGALLEAQVDRLEGRAGALLPPAGAAAPWPYAGEENWLAAEVLAPSPERAGAARRALDELPGPVPDERVRLAWGIGVEEARALRLESAQGLQEALHRRFRAVWSAMDLALTLTRLGSYAAADQVLGEQIAGEEAAGSPSGELWAQRGTAALGAGDEARGRDYLGLGVARGSLDAAVVLARLDLEQGRLSAARAGFRALLFAEEPIPWAPKGWGLTLLPETPVATWSADQARTAGE